ncbi:hypothetical protein [Lacticaseibacillus pantheris]|jgi:hypothetical protein|uniref:CHRD domain-containing protein n=1 Tax=Lacticaseibacillus pantheris DSM 15945 = JCM 12539 = NBRC 106106 TaxID=1423783 RepID=A0A0R1TXH9_9LACO|nr:hypothetical protein [Lacticaseibacillus pantheris]KRL85894.1 hypothetical protein FC50_GL001293 [Lacticaseibacillus pantheris DSM 15945 = JCM 12539 = NBRC 106106]WKF85223.1 hypothetical protein QY874_01015 [Lacticaseibacillus pantheris]
MTTYKAEIVPLNANKIGTSAHGTASLELTDTELTITIEMFGTPASTEHWEHFHGFPDGRAAEIATAAQDVNGDGFVDLMETESVSGTTMVPFDDAPEHMDIPHDRYPVADADGHFAYTKVVPLAELQDNFANAFGSRDLQLDRRVIYIHGVPADLQLPDSVAGMVGMFDAHVTLPIAVGKIVRVD